MTFNNLVSLIAKAEGRKHQASVGDVREILSLCFELCRSKKYGEELCYLINKEVNKKSKKPPRWDNE